MAKQVSKGSRYRAFSRMVNEHAEVFLNALQSPLHRWSPLHQAHFLGSRSSTGDTSAVIESATARLALLLPAVPETELAHSNIGIQYRRNLPQASNPQAGMHYIGDLGLPVGVLASKIGLSAFLHFDAFPRTARPQNYLEINGDYIPGFLPGVVDLITATDRAVNVYLIGQETLLDRTGEITYNS